MRADADIPRRLRAGAATEAAFFRPEPGGRPGPRLPGGRPRRGAVPWRTAIARSIRSRSATNNSRTSAIEKSYTTPEAPKATYPTYNVSPPPPSQTTTKRCKPKTAQPSQPSADTLTREPTPTTEIRDPLPTRTRDPKSRIPATLYPEFQRAHENPSVAAKGCEPNTLTQIQSPHGVYFRIESERLPGPNRTQWNGIRSTHCK